MVLCIFLIQNMKGISILELHANKTSEKFEFLGDLFKS